MKVYNSLEDLVGNTPLLALQKYGKAKALNGNLFGKMELFNPTGSVKDRIAKQMILDAEENGLLKPGSTIIEPTSGNTGIGLTAMGVARGYRVIITMPETMSLERRNLMSIYGAELVLTPGSLGMKGAIAKANELAEMIPNSFIPSQFVNPANPKAHYNTTGPEIWEALDGKVDILVSGVGTGGTISGTGAYLKEKNKHVKVIAIEPASSPVLSKGTSGPHKIQGIGAGFVPDTLNQSIYDEIITVSNEDAYETAKEFVRLEGLFVGISAGAALWAATKLASMPENASKNIVVILPDSGDRYLSNLQN